MSHSDTVVLVVYRNHETTKLTNLNYKQLQVFVFGVPRVCIMTSFAQQTTPDVNSPHILLMGPRRSGKSSIQRVVFYKMSPHETLFLESTNTLGTSLFFFPSSLTTKFNRSFVLTLFPLFRFALPYRLCVWLVVMLLNFQTSSMLPTTL